MNVNVTSLNTRDSALSHSASTCNSSHQSPAITLRYYLQYSICEFDEFMRTIGIVFVLHSAISVQNIAMAIGRSVSTVVAGDGRRAVAGDERRGRLQFQFLSLHLGAMILEPQLHVLRLERRKTLSIGGPVQLVRVLFDRVR